MNVYTPIIVTSTEICAYDLWNLPQHDELDALLLN